LYKFLIFSRLYKLFINSSYFKSTNHSKLFISYFIASPFLNSMSKVSFKPLINSVPQPMRRAWERSKVEQQEESRRAHWRAYVRGRGLTYI
jgi:hypothetical protein